MSNSETIQNQDTQANSNKEILNETMINYGQAIQQLVFTYVKDYAMAEDLTQEIFLKFYSKLHTFKRESSLKTWLYRIAINHCKDYLRSWHHRHFTLDEERISQVYANEKLVEQDLIQKTEEQRLVLAVLKLPLKYRESVYLYYYEELTTKEISQMMQKNENTIKTRLNRARQMIKKELGEEDLL